MSLDYAYAVGDDVCHREVDKGLTLLNVHTLLKASVHTNGHSENSPAILLVQETLIDTRRLSYGLYTGKYYTATFV